MSLVLPFWRMLPVSVGGSTRGSIDGWPWPVERTQQSSASLDVFYPGDWDNIPADICDFLSVDGWRFEVEFAATGWTSRSLDVVIKTGEFSAHTYLMGGVDNLSDYAATSLVESFQVQERNVDVTGTGLSSAALELCRFVRSWEETAGGEVANYGVDVGVGFPTPAIEDSVKGWLVPMTVTRHFQTRDEIDNSIITDIQDDYCLFDGQVAGTDSIGVFTLTRVTIDGYY